jgi:hypothetical protein
MATKIRLAILSLWLGVMVLFSFVVAPATFAALPETNLAGHVVSVVLGRVEFISIVLGIFAIVALLMSRGQSGKAFVLELITLATMTFSMIFSHFVVSRRMHEIKFKFGGGINSIPQSDPAHIAFNQLHSLSVGLMTFAIITALILVVVLVTRSSERSG